MTEYDYTRKWNPFPSVFPKPTLYELCREEVERRLICEEAERKGEYSPYHTEEEVLELVGKSARAAAKKGFVPFDNSNSTRTLKDLEAEVDTLMEI